MYVLTFLAKSGGTRILLYVHCGGAHIKFYIVSYLLLRGSNKLYFSTCWINSIVSYFWVQSKRGQDPGDSNTIGTPSYYTERIAPIGHPGREEWVICLYPHIHISAPHSKPEIYFVFGKAKTNNLRFSSLFYWYLWCVECEVTGKIHAVQVEIGLHIAVTFSRLRTLAPALIVPSRRATY